MSPIQANFDKKSIEHSLLDINLKPSIAYCDEYISILQLEFINTIQQINSRDRESITISNFISNTSIDNHIGSGYVDNETYNKYLRKELHQRLQQSIEKYLNNSNLNIDYNKGEIQINI